MRTYLSGEIELLFRLPDGSMSALAVHPNMKEALVAAYAVAGKALVSERPAVREMRADAGEFLMKGSET